MSNSHFQAYFHGLCWGVGLIKLLPCQLLPFSTLSELRNMLQDCIFLACPAIEKSLVAFIFRVTRKSLMDYSWVFAQLT